MVIAALITWNTELINQNKDLHQNINKLHAELSTVIKPQTIANANSVAHKENITITTSKQVAQVEIQNYTAPKHSENNNIITTSVKNEKVKNIPNEIKEENTTLISNNKTPAIAQSIQSKTEIEAPTNERITENIIKDTVITKKKIVEDVNQKTQNIAENNDKGKDELQHPISNFHNIHYNAGLNLIAGRNQVGSGISGEALLKDRWGLSVGINVLGINNQNYNDDQDFTNCKHTPFTAIYNLHNNDSVNRYFHIKIDDILFQIPLAINYHLELRHKFSLVVGAGTDLDIYVKQRIGYIHKLDSLSNNDKLGHKFPPDLFNDLVFTAGIQKRCGLFLLQLCPYVSYQVHQVIYKKEELYYGMRFGIKFNFPG